MSPIRRIALAAGEIGVLLALTACAPDHGVVHGKKYEPPHTYTTFRCMSHDSKTGACTFNMPIVNHEPAHYYFDLYDEHGNHGWREVDPTSYERYPIGRDYP